ncbi:cupin domain-containing protein [Roseibium sp. RKSG952]|uniref:cupin domain-containing protein n=1 Tax=Roseibium sp. RKSG952 TaxID=2529384 RepID=UPI0012BC82F5|nr:cupin domain-containing protein [Roseibium sp. RKSG952]MTH98977.1 cupin domain-containing protein [Roseibium sp. RKSG952]
MIETNRVARGLFAFALILSVSSGLPAIAADKSLTPGAKPGPAAPGAKPGEDAASGAEVSDKVPYTSVRDVFSGDKTVAGEPLVFPRRNESIKSVVVTLGPGEATAWHQHGVPTFGYILEGELTVTYEGVGKRVYRKGDGFLEAMHATHRGVNTGEGLVQVLAVFMLGDGKQPTIPEQAPGETREKIQ